MMAGADWAFKMPWLVPALSVWLKLSAKVRLLAMLLAIASAFGTSVIAYEQRAEQPTTVVPQTIALPSAEQFVPRLPAINSTALYELTRQFHNPRITQQRDTVSLTFEADWRSFAIFSNKIAQSNLAPQSYQLHWRDRHSPAELSSTGFLLAPGDYQGASIEPITFADTEQLSMNAANVPEPDCQASVFPSIVVQAAWPSRGYIQVLLNGRSERLAINQKLEHSWQLLRIGSESVEFRWHAANPACAVAESFTVAI